MAQMMGFVLAASALVSVAILTDGAILLPLEGALLLAPLVVVNYLLWGRSCLKRILDRTIGERERLAPSNSSLHGELE